MIADGLISRGRRWTTPVALGLSDGILNALVLSSARLLRDSRGIAMSFAVKVGCVALVTAVFTVFVAEYAGERVRLSRATRQLNLSKSGHLATTSLRRRVILRAGDSAGIAGVASFAGATSPLVVAGAIRNVPWVGLLAAIVLLGLLGVALAATFNARRIVWAAALVVAGIIVAAIGAWLDIT